RLVSIQRGYDVREFALIAYGGAGPVHAEALARMAGVSRIVVPAHSGAFSALGCLVSPLRYDAVQTYRASLDGFDPEPLEERFAELEARCRQPLEAEGVVAHSITVARSVDLRYVGQNYELEVPYNSDVTRVRAAFEARHRQLYGYATGESIECVNARLVAMVASADDVPFEAGRARAPSPELVGERRAFFPAAGEVTLRRYARASLGNDTVVDGPAVIEDDWSTVVVCPGQRCTANQFGDLVIDDR